MGEVEATLHPWSIFERSSWDAQIDNCGPAEIVSVGLSFLWHHVHAFSFKKTWSEPAETPQRVQTVTRASCRTNVNAMSPLVTLRDVPVSSCRCWIWITAPKIDPNSQKEIKPQDVISCLVLSIKAAVFLKAALRGSQFLQAPRKQNKA